MSIQLQGANSVNVQADAYAGSLRKANVPRGMGYSISSVTGTVAAALTANSSVFVMRLNPGSPKLAYITELRAQFTTIVAFTTANTAARRLEIFRGSGASASGGTALAAAVPQSQLNAPSQFNAAIGGDMRISTTAALTVTGITYETQCFRSIQLATFGTAGAKYEFERRWDAPQNQPIVLLPGQLLAVRNPVAMDAAGTWTLAVDVEWYEL